MINPPTERQLKRVYQLLDHPAIEPFLDKLMVDIPKAIRTRGGTGVTIQWMKMKVEEYEKRQP